MAHRLLRPHPAWGGEGSEFTYFSPFVDGLVTYDDEHYTTANRKSLQYSDILKRMRFFPETIYNREEHNVADGYHQYINGVHFIKPNFNGNTQDFHGMPAPKASFLKSVGRALTILALLCVPIIGWAYLARNTKLIEAGNFGHAKDMHGNIEIYKPGHRYVSLSPYTAIKKHHIGESYVNIENRQHLVNVPEGHYAFANIDKKPVILQPGRHLIESTTFELEMAGEKPRFEPMNNQLIKHGDSYIIRVPEGQVAFGTRNGRTRLLEHEYNQYSEDRGGFGAYIFHDPQFKLGTFSYTGEAHTSHFTHTSRNEIVMGPVRVLTVPERYAKVTYNNGERVVLGKGRHVLGTAQHTTTKGMVDLTRQTLNIVTDETIPSKDCVRLNVTATLTYTIKDVDKLYTNIGEDYPKIILDRASSLLRQLIKESDFNQTKEMQKARTPDLKGKASSSSLTPYDPEKADESMMAQIGDRLYNELKEQLNEEHGIELGDINIIQCMPKDLELQKDLEAEAKTIAESQVKLARATTERKQALIAAESAREVKKIQAESDAETKAIQAQSEADYHKIQEVTSAQATAESTRLRGEADLHLTQRKAETEAAAKERLAEADRKAHEERAAGLKAYDAFGQQHAMMHATGDATRGLMQGANVSMVTDSMKNAVPSLLIHSAAANLFTGRALRQDLHNAAGDLAVMNVANRQSLKVNG